MSSHFLSIAIRVGIAYGAYQVFILPEAQAVASTLRTIAAALIS